MSQASNQHMRGWNQAWSRRQVLRDGLAAALCWGSLGAARSARHSWGRTESLPRVRTITRGPKYHWFGYYDKLEFDPSGRYVLGMEVDFEHRSPTPDDQIKIGMVDLIDGDRWIELGATHAWCWQQGCMLQWIPGSSSKIIWNDRERDRFVSRILDIDSRETRTLDHAIYALAPNGKSGVSTDFSRLADLRPGYGYVGLPDRRFDELAPQDTGVYRVDLQTGQQELLLSFAEIASLGRTLPSMEGAKHKVNHLLFNQDGSRFFFLHRWLGPKGRETRLFTLSSAGEEPRILDDNGLTSHLIWRDPGTILAFSRRHAHGDRFYLFEDSEQGAVEVVGADVMTADGHCSYLPGNEWILNDTYPDLQRLQHPYLFHVLTGQRVPLGHFHSPPEYTGEWRCDTHPRISPDGKHVVIDSPHTGAGRQLHLIDLEV